MNHLIFEDLGIIDYEIALQIQQKYFDENIYNILNGLETIDRILFCQHPAVYTIGKNGDAQNLLSTPSDAKLFQTNRGGDITFHGLGQWVVYPILNLEKRNMGLAKYVEILEQIGIDICSQYAIRADRSEGESGVWIDINQTTARKIMAIGIKASRKITMHGLAFNVNTNLQYFENIIPCGIRGKSVTSLAVECQRTIDMDEVKDKFTTAFKNYFH